MTAARLAFSEKEFQDQVIALARTLGYKAMHSRPAMNRRGHWETPLTGDAGFPDLCLVGTGPRRGRLLFVELKSATETVQSAQAEWLARLSDTAAEVYVWTPNHWPEPVQSVLSADLAHAPHRVPTLAEPEVQKSKVIPAGHEGERMSKPRLLDLIERMREALQSCATAGNIGAGDELPRCCLCGSYSARHEPDCEIAAALQAGDLGLEDSNG
jgi:hypothetical protein